MRALDAASPVSASEGGNAGGATVVPPLRIRDFNFTSLSDAV